MELFNPFVSSFLLGVTAECLEMKKPPFRRMRLSTSLSK
jgi:hypothetical protein